MTGKIKYIILAALVASLGLGVGFAVLRANLLKRPELILEEAARRMDLNLKDIDYTQISGERKEWTLKAKQVSYEQERDTFNLELVRVTVYRPSGMEIEIKGKLGLFNRKEGWVRIEGEAQLTNDQGFELKADTFMYNLEKQELTSPDMVHLKGPGLRISGRGIMVNVAEWKAVFRSEVTSEWRGTTENKGA